jgi:hypothetical protein
VERPWTQHRHDQRIVVVAARRHARPGMDGASARRGGGGGAVSVAHAGATAVG